MKIISIIIFLCCLLNVFDASAQQNDTTIINKYGDFLFESSAPMKVDLIVKGKPVAPRISKGDTLYHDSKYTILGDREDFVGMGVYKKYQTKYQFSMFKVPVYKGKLAAPNFKTDPAALMYRTNIKEQCKSQGINFSGHFTVVEWGCGTECENIAIVDRINGEIYYSTIPYGADEGYYGTKYRADSKLIILNSFNLEDHKGYELWREYGRTRLCVWKGNDFKNLPR
jgi:hypothetical protein